MDNDLSRFVGNGQRPCLLVVDDQATNLMQISQVFSEQYELLIARSGAEALAICDKNVPDLILLDKVMPEMDGLDVCSTLKKNKRTCDIPIIFVTAYGTLEEENQCWQAGASDFINKPINPLTLMNRVKVHLAMKEQADRLKEIAFVDGLTSVYNRRYFDERMIKEWRRCQRSKQALSLIMADIDCFKRYNDRYGHIAGDICLKQVAMAIKSQLHRPYDFAARYGGEEFVCLLPETTIQGAEQCAQRMEKAVKALNIKHECSLYEPIVTASFGIACLVPNSKHAGPEELIAIADKKLYEAKERRTNDSLNT